MKFLTLLFLVFSNCEGIDSTNETAYFAFRRVKISVIYPKIYIKQSRTNNCDFSKIHRLCI